MREAMEKIEKKRQKEIQSMNLILDLYEKGHKEEKEIIEELREYSVKRIRSCPKMATKTYCSNCEIHCYKPEFREKIKKVMRYAGPRLLLRHPFKALDHAWKRLLYQRQKKKERKSTGSHQNDVIL